MNPIGVTFMPSAENQAQGPQRGALEGDLGQAFKILSLRLPSVQGAHAITPQANLASPGSAGVQGAGFNPQAAIFEALLRAMAGGPQGQSGTVGGGPVATQPFVPPRITPGDSMAQSFTGQPAAPAAGGDLLRRGPLTRDAGY